MSQRRGARPGSRPDGTTGPGTSASRAGRRPTIAILGSASALIALFWIGAAPALAQEAPPDASPDAPPDAPEEKKPAPDLSPDEERARELYIEGDRRYAEGRYEESIALFEEAYELVPRPLMLYNMANAYERMGAYEEAADALSRYIGSGDAEDTDTLRQRLGQIRKRAAAKAEAAEELAALRGRPSSCPEPVPCPVDDAPQDDSDRWAYVLFATGGASVIATVTFGVVARGAASDARDLCTGAGGARYCSDGAESALDRERRFALLTDIGIGVSAAAIGAGAYLFWRHRQAEAESERRRRGARVVPALVPGGVGVTFAGSF